MFDVYGKRLEPDKTPIASVLRSGSAQRNSEVVIERPDGTRITVLSNAAPLCDGKGKLLGALEVFHDITERRWSEAARRVADRLAASARVASQVAQQIKKVAAEHGVPTMENPPLARALFKACEIDQEIPGDMYAAVAELLAFVYRIRTTRLQAVGAAI